MHVYYKTLKLWVQIPLSQGLLNTTLCDKVCQWLAAGRWFPPSINLTTHDQILLNNETGLLYCKIEIWWKALQNELICLTFHWMNWKFLKIAISGQKCL